MRYRLSFIVLFAFCVTLGAQNTINIPLWYKVVQLLPKDNPTGSTPDPTDPNQFRVSLTGNTLTVKTQENAASYVVIRSDFSDKQGEDYFYSLSFDSVSCPLTPGKYTIYIGCWNYDFYAELNVMSIRRFDSSGRFYDIPLDAPLPPGNYILRVETSEGASTLKQIILP